MATKDTEKKSVTNLEYASDHKEAEYDLVTALLEAANYKTSEENITPVDIKRNGKFLFSVNIHPLGAEDARLARKRATTMMPNPNGKKLPQIEKEFNAVLFQSWLIYLATTEEDQQKVWGNPAIMKKFSLNLPVESVDILLNFGEKQRLYELVSEISGMNDDDEGETMDEEEYAKN